MKGYRTYMDRQQVNPSLHQRLLALEQQEQAPRPVSLSHWKPLLAMAACICLVVGLVAWGGPRYGRSGGGMKHETSAAAHDTAAPSQEWEEDKEAAPPLPEPEEAGTSAKAEAVPTEDCAPAEPDAGTVGTAVTEERSNAPARLRPGWLPEGYALAEEQPRTGGERLVWTGTDGESITLEYAWGEPLPEEPALPVYDRLTAQWEEVSQAAGQEEVWGFCLVDEETDGWQCYTTTGDHETLWQVAMSVTEN